MLMSTIDWLYEEKRFLKVSAASRRPGETACPQTRVFGMSMMGFCIPNAHHQGAWSGRHLLIGGVSWTNFGIQVEPVASEVPRGRRLISEGEAHLWPRPLVLGGSGLGPS